MEDFAQGWSRKTSLKVTSECKRQEMTHVATREKSISGRRNRTRRAGTLASAMNLKQAKERMVDVGKVGAVSGWQLAS